MISGREPNIVACMEPQEQAKALAKEHRALVRNERKEQNLFAAWLSLQRDAGKLWFINPRSDKPTTIALGHPDFSIWLSAGRSLLMEFKLPGGTFSKEQREALRRLQLLAHPVVIVATHEDAIRIVQGHLNAMRRDFNPTL